MPTELFLILYFPVSYIANNKMADAWKHKVGETVETLSSKSWNYGSFENMHFCGVNLLIHNKMAAAWNLDLNFGLIPIINDSLELNICYKVQRQSVSMLYAGNYIC